MVLRHATIFLKHFFTGHNNIVAISATTFSSEDSLRLIRPEARSCWYKNEISNLTIFKSFSQSNCYFECFYNKAKEFVKNKYNTTQGCVPWYFPTAEYLPLFCNPWEAADFLDKMLKGSTKNCLYCLPECSETIYKTHVTTVPLINCYLDVLGNSPLCKNALQNPAKIYSIIRADNGRGEYRRPAVRRL